MAESFLGSTGAKQLGLMLRVVAFFHSSEYVLAVAIHGNRNVHLSSLRISKPYIFAMICLLREYALEIWLVPGLKEQWWIGNFGLIVVIIGELIHKISILSRAFTRLTRIYFQPQSELVTYGVYRHTDYALQSYLCSSIYIGYLEVLFPANTVYEEFFLRQYFGERYAEYARRVPSGIPFVK